MGSKKHKKHKSERREKYDDRQFCLERPPGLKLIFKMGGTSSTPEHGGPSTSESPAHTLSTNHHQHHLLHLPQSAQQLRQDSAAELSGAEYSGGGGGGDHKPKKSKKKKKKKDRERRHHKHSHKEKRRRADRGADDSSQDAEEMSGGEDNSLQLQEAILKYADMSAANSLANSPVTKPMVPLLKSPVHPYTFLDSQDGFQSAAGVPASACAGAGAGGGTPLGSPLPSGAAAAGAAAISDYKSSPEEMKSPSSDCSRDGREPRSCVLKQKQSRSPLCKLLDHLLRSLEKKDPHQFFAWPVTDDIAPGYSSIITEPMDFLSIRQKVDDNEYGTLQEFGDDFRLMCANAIKYNHVDTVYHKAAKRLLHVGGKMLQPEQLLRSLRPLMVYMRALTPRELGFDLAHAEQWQVREGAEAAGGGMGGGGGSGGGGGGLGGCGGLDSADEGMSMSGAEDLTQAQQEEEEKRKNIRRINNPTSRFSPFVDDLTADEILAQVQSAAKAARSRIASRRNASKMGFLRQARDGTTSMRIMVANSNDCPERVVSIGAFTGKLQQGTGQLQGFREDRRNAAKIVKPLNYGTFCSFAPQYDSRFATLSREESELVLNTYGDETGSEYAASIMDFSRDSSYASTLANGLLDILTQGEHRKTVGQLMESQYQRYEQGEIERTFPPTAAANIAAVAAAPVASAAEATGAAMQPVNFEALRTLADIPGIDVSFLPALEQAHRGEALAQQLSANGALIERLQQVQTERLSQPLPAHLANVARPAAAERELATQLQTQLTEMAKQLTPAAVAEPLGLRKALGLSTVGMSITSHPEQGAQAAAAAGAAAAATVANRMPVLETKAAAKEATPHSAAMDIIDTTPIPMDLEPEADD